MGNHLDTIDMVELRQDLVEASLSLFAIGDAVSRIPGADETLGKGMCLAIQSLARDVENVLPPDADNHTCLSPSEHTRLMNVSAMLLAAVDDGEVEVETARSAASEIRAALGAMS